MEYMIYYQNIIFLNSMFVRKLKSISELNLAYDQIGFFELLKLTQYTQFISLLFYFFLVQIVYTSIGLIAQNSKQSNLYVIKSLENFASILIIISFGVKIVATILIFQISDNGFRKKLCFILLVSSQQIFFFSDSILFLVYLYLINTTVLSYFTAILAAINLIYTFALKFIDQILVNNYSYMCENPLKQKINFKIWFLREVLILGIIFQILVINSQIIYTFFVNALIYVFIQIYNQIVYLSYSNNQIRKIKLFKICLIMSISASTFLSLCFQMIKENLILIFMIITIFLTSSILLYIENKLDKLLQRNIDEIDQENDTYIKLSYISQLLKIFDDQSIMKLSTTLMKHELDCVDVTCICKQKISQKGKSEITDFDILKIKKKMNFFLLQLSLENKMKFELISVNLLYISALGSLNLYPKLFHEIKCCEEFFKEELSVYQICNLQYIKNKVSDSLNQRNKKINVINIQKVRYFQNNFNQLLLKINLHCWYKAKFWYIIQKNNISISMLSQNLTKDCQLKDQILLLASNLIQISYSNQLQRIMSIYCRLVLRDLYLERSIRQRFKKSGENQIITINGKSINLIENPNTCLIKISIDLKNMGNITWHSKNIQNVFKFKKNKKIIGQNVNILMPDIYKQEHDKFLLKWFQRPNETKINNISEVYISTQYYDFVKANLYIKILPFHDYFQIIGMIIKASDDEYLVLNDSMETINQPHFLKEIIKQNNIILQQSVNICLTCNKLLDLFVNNFSSLKNGENEIHKLELRIKIPENYDAICIQYKQKLDQIKNIQKISKQQYKERLLNLNIYTNLKIQSSNSLLDFQIFVYIKQINISSNHYYILQYLDYEIFTQTILDKPTFMLQNDLDDLIIHQINQLGHLNTINIENVNNNHKKSESDIFKNSQSLNTDSKLNGQNIYQQIQYSSYSEFSTIKVKKQIATNTIQNKFLYYTQKVFFCKIIIFIVCIILKLIYSNIYISAFNQFSRFNSNFTQIVVSSQLLYQYSIQLYKEYKTPNLSQKNKYYLINQTKYFQNSISKLLQASNRYHQNYYIQNIYEYITYKAMFQIDSGELNLSNNIMYSLLLVNTKQLVQVFQNPINNSKSSKLESNIQFLFDNFHNLFNATNNLLIKYQELGKNCIFNLNKVNQIMFPIEFIIVLIFLIHLNYYLYRTQKEKQEFLSIFISIPYNNIIQYHQYYENCYQNIQSLYQTKLIHKSVPKNKNVKTKQTLIFKQQKVKSYFIISLLILSLSISWQTFSGYQIIRYSSPMITQYELMNSLIKQQHLYIQNFIQFHQIQNHIDLQYANITIYQPEINFINYFSKILASSVDLSNIQTQKNIYLNLILSNICQVLKIYLQPWQYQNCLLIQQPIMNTGILSASNLVQRALYQRIQIQSGSQNQKTSIINPDQFFEIDKSIFYQYKIYILIEEKIIEGILKVSNYLMRIIEYMSIINIVVLIILSFGFIYFIRIQKQNYKLQYKYLLCIPDEQYQQNNKIQKILNKFNKKSFNYK